MGKLIPGSVGWVLSLCIATAATGANLSCKDHRVDQLPDACLSSPGTIDPAFGDGGASLLASTHYLVAAAAQPDGKIVAVGSPRTTTGTPREFVLVRVTPDGVPDTGFGNGGQVRSALGPLGGGPSVILVQPDGRILVAGSAWLNLDADFYKQASAFAVMRFLADGQLDATYGDAGRVTTAIGWTATLSALFLQPDGRIVAQGERCESERTHCALALARYHADGTPDTTLGNEGTVVVDKVFAYGSWSTAVQQADGKLVIAWQHPVVHLSYTCSSRFGCRCTDDAGNGVSCPLTPQQQAANTASGLLRLNQDGTVDRLFGVDGTAVTPFPASRLMASADGKIAIAGASFVADRNYPWLTLARYDTAGAPDSTFGNQGIAANLLPGGVLLQAWVSDVPVSLLQQPDGKLVAVANRGDQFDWSGILVARYMPDGQLDRTFNGQGYIHTVKTTLDFAAGSTLLADGKIIVVADIWQQGSGLLGYRGDEVVEFRNSETGHYFMTVDPAEQASIATGGSGPGWMLTGESFKSNAATRVCRFTGAADRGSRSHFFTLDPAECEHVKLDAGWRFEGLDFAASPTVDGGCPAVSAPVFRAYNNGFARNDSNHRYTTSAQTYQSMIAAGWIGEGTVFCVAR